LRNFGLACGASALTMAVILVAAFMLDHAEQDRHRVKLRAETLNHVSAARARLESVLNAKLFITGGLAAYVSNHPEIGRKEFQSFASALVRQQHGIRSIQLAKNSIVSHIYPMAGNEVALGLKLLAQPKQRDAVLRVIKSRDTVVAGPVELVQGGTAFVSRTPIFLAPPDGKPDSGDYWGLATVILDKDSLFEEAGLSQDSASFHFALRGKDSTGASGETFWGDPRLFEENSVRLDVTLPNGSWQIAAAPQSGGATLEPRGCVQERPYWRFWPVCWYGSGCATPPTCANGWPRRPAPCAPAKRNTGAHGTGAGGNFSDRLRWKFFAGQLRELPDGRQHPGRNDSAQHPETCSQRKNCRHVAIVYKF